jgi:outer membrane protein insertion porin family
MKIMRLLGLLLLLSNTVIATEIRHIVITGNQRFSEETILNYASIDRGDDFQESDSAQIISNLFITDFFDNIVVDFHTTSQTLFIQVTEKPVLGEIAFKGNYHFSDNEIEKSLSEYNIDVGRTLNQRSLSTMIRELLMLYNLEGYYEARITYTLDDLDNGAKCLNLKIEEGETAKIHRISFHGNLSYPADVLLWQMSLQPTNFMTMLTSADKYGEYKLEHDCQALTDFYHNDGYPDMRIVEKKVSLTPEQKGIIIDIFIDEGEKQWLSDVAVLLPDDVVLSELEPFDLPIVWNKTLINDYEQSIRDALNVNGYVYGEIQQQKESLGPGECRLVYRVAPGEKYRIATYHFKGNTLTNEGVLRNFVTRPEGTYYSSSDINELNESLSRTGLFSNVQINPVRKNNKEVDLDVFVTEDKTKKFFAMGGVSTIDTGFSWSLGYEDRNIFGTGMKTSLKFEADNFENVFQFSLINPYLTHNNLEGFFSIEKVQRSYKNDYMYFKQDRNIFSVASGLSWYLNKKIRAGISLNYFSEKDKNEQQAIDNNEDPWAHYVFFTTRLHQNQLNKYIMADRGYYWECGSQVSLPLGDYTYTDNHFKIQKYTPLQKSGYILYNAVTFRGMYPFGYAPKNEIPSTRLLYCGGVGDIRGYHFSSVGPEIQQEISPGVYEYKTVGGNVKLTSRNELIFPNSIFNLPFDQIRISLFIDAAQLWRTDSVPVPDAYNTYPNTYIPSQGIKVSGGLCLRFVSQILPPITVSINQPLTWDKKDQKKYEPFSFSTQVDF